MGSILRALLQQFSIHGHGYWDMFSSFVWGLFLDVLILVLDTLILTAIIAGIVTWIRGGKVKFGDFFSQIVFKVFIFEILFCLFT